MAGVLFVCLHNAGRSQMSEAQLTRAVAGSRARSVTNTQAHEKTDAPPGRRQPSARRGGWPRRIVKLVYLPT